MEVIGAIDAVNNANPAPRNPGTDSSKEVQKFKEAFAEQAAKAKEDVEVLGAGATLSKNESFGNRAGALTGVYNIGKAVLTDESGADKSADLIEGFGQLGAAGGLPVGGYTGIAATTIRAGMAASAESSPSDVRFLGLTADGWGAIANGATVVSQTAGGAVAAVQATGTGPAGMALAFNKGAETTGNAITLGRFVAAPLVVPLVNALIPLPTSAPADSSAIPRNRPLYPGVTTSTDVAPYYLQADPASPAINANAPPVWIGQALTSLPTEPEPVSPDASVVPTLP